jgi:hypothetical protein
MHEIGGDWGLVALLIFKISGSSIASGGFDSHPPPPREERKQFFFEKKNQKTFGY